MVSCASPTSHQAIVLKDDFIEARLLRAEALTKMLQYKEATEDIDAILAQDAENESALLLRAGIRQAQGDIETAQSICLHVIALNPFNEQAYLLLGTLYISEKNYTQAIQLYDEAIEMNVNFAQAYHERGRAKLLNGDKDGSMEDMKRSLELVPKAEEAINGAFSNQAAPQKTDILGL